jgi:hypothetical protein
VVVARLAAGLMLLLQVFVLTRVVAAAAGPLVPEGPRVAWPAGVALVAAVTAGIVLTLAGRAGLVHPATRRHVRPPAPVPAAQPQFSWSAWSPGVPPQPQPPQPQPQAGSVTAEAPGQGWVAP